MSATNGVSEVKSEVKSEVASLTDPEPKADSVNFSNDVLDRDIKLVSKDKQKNELKVKDALISTLVKTALETDKEATEVDVPGVNNNILTEVVAYINHHKGVDPPIVEKPLRSKVMKDVVKDAWDAEFIDRIGEDRQKLYDLILAANYMDIKSLLHLGCAKVASLIKGQPLEKIKEILSKGVKTEGGVKDDAKSNASDKGDKKGN